MLDETLVAGFCGRNGAPVGFRIISERAICEGGGIYMGIKNGIFTEPQMKIKGGLGLVKN